MSALPLNKPLSALAHFIVVLDHRVDMANPNTPTDMEVTSALEMKYRVFVVDGIIAGFQLVKSKSHQLVSKTQMKSKIL